MPRSLPLPITHTPSFVHAFQHRRALWRSRRALAALTRAQLCDVGITPTQATREVRRPIWDAPASWKC